MSLVQHNAKLNFSKSVALTLTGQAPPPLLKTHLAAHGITRWYSQDDPDPLIYLGIPVLYNRRQRNTFMDKLTLTVKHHTGIHRSRQLSILCQATVLNTLVLYKIWHSLRFLPVSHQQLQCLRSVLVQFTSRQNFPAIGYAKLIQTKQYGGLGLLDPFNQLLALQVLILRSLLSPLVIMPPIHQILAGFVRKQSHQADPAIPFFMPNSGGTFTAACRRKPTFIAVCPRSSHPLSALFFPSALKIPITLCSYARSNPFFGLPLCKNFLPSQSIAHKVKHKH
ncbi:hypothetical protein [Absidia glauca]|uniref:Uncharacterized protein n=1 Tax=Absidia glauca TaxID=4829 RepID=A0A168N9K1_ABSGL|nr:hypothetical protein [Absidia glauca]